MCLCQSLLIFIVIKQSDDVICFQLLDQFIKKIKTWYQIIDHRHDRSNKKKKKYPHFLTKKIEIKTSDSRLRAPTAGVVNVPNVKYFAHLPHQTQKWCFMRCAKSQKLYNIATVPLQICNGTDKCGKIFYCFIFFFSLLSLHFFFSLLSHSLVPSLLPQTPILSS